MVRNALHCALQPITHYLQPCVPCFLSLSLALFSLLYLPYLLCAPHLSPSLAPSALFPFPVRARCKHFAGHLLDPLFRGPPSPPALCSCLILPPTPSACTRTVQSSVQGNPFPTLLPSPSLHPPLGSPRCPVPLFPLG